MLGVSSPRLVEQLYEAASWDARFDLLDRTILLRLEQTPSAPADVTWAWRRLRETSGRLAIGELATELAAAAGT